jgi:hypothetical protein
MWKSIRDDTKIVHAIWFCIAVHHAVALLNAYVGNVIGAEGDARSFHFYGVTSSELLKPEWVAWGNSVVTYNNFLGFFYRVFGASSFFGGELSVLAFTLSCVVLVKLVYLLDLRHIRVGIVLFFGLLPSAVIFRSVTLRESWQALFFLLYVYWTIRLWKQPGILNVSFLLISVSCLALTHHGFAKIAMYLIAISVFWWICDRKKGVRCARHVRLLFAGLLVACVIMLIPKVGWYMSVGQVLKGVEWFRQEAVEVAPYARAMYGVVLDTSSVLGTVKTISMMFVQYMFAPFPWQVGNVKDIYALLESMLRFVLLFFAVSSRRRFSGEARSYYSFLLIIFLGMELMWALGTINWGTATRHHVPGYSVLVLLGVPGLIIFIRRLHFRMLGRREVSRFQDREKFVKPDPEINEI